MFLFKKKKKTKKAKSNNIQGKIIPSKKSATAETLTGGMPRPPEEPQSSEVRGQRWWILYGLGHHGPFTLKEMKATEGLEKNGDIIRFML